MRAPRVPWLGVPRGVWGIVAFATLVRVASALYQGDHVDLLPGVADQLSYHTLATRVLEGHGFTFGEGWWPATPANEPTAHWSFLYTLFLTGVYAIVGVHPLAARLLQALIVGVAQPVLAWRLGTRLFGDRVGRMAAVVAAGYAYFVFYGGALMTESFYFVAVLWAVDATCALAALRPEQPTRTVLFRGLQWGLALAMGVLLRQTWLLLTPFLAAWATWVALSSRVHRFARCRGVVAAMVVGMAVVVLAIVPWTLRNTRAFGQTVLLNTNAGFAFFWGNHPVHGEAFSPLLADGQAYASLIPEELRGLNEGALDRALLARGLAFVADDPLRYLRLSASRVVEYVKFWPTPDSGRTSNAARVLSFGVMWPFALGGVWLATRRRGMDTPAAAGSDAQWLVLGVAVVHSLIYLLTWTLVRYRLPVDALLTPFMALALVRVGEHWRLWPFVATGESTASARAPIRLA